MKTVRDILTPLEKDLIKYFMNRNKNIDNLFEYKLINVFIGKIIKNAISRFKELEY